MHYIYRCKTNIVKTTILPLPDKPALVVKRKITVLVLADIHLGLEAEMWKKGIRVPSQTGRILERAIECIEEAEPDRIVLLGDVKHNVPLTSWQELRDVPVFLERIAESAPVEIVPGNHDVFLRRMISSEKISLHSSRGFVLDGAAYLHGHAWPDAELLRCKNLVIGHIHPAFEFRDELGARIKERVWVRAKMNAEKLPEKLKGGAVKSSVFVMPAFNELLGGTAVNAPQGRLIGPLFRSRCIDLRSGKIYLLDGTSLGQAER